MPYRYAWLVIAALIAATVLAFWPGYFSVLGAAPLAFHLHGATASLWMLLMVAQSWAIHHQQRALHRSLGLLTFAAVPLFLMGGLAVIQSMARATVAGADPFYAIYGARLGSYDTLSTLAFGYLSFMALKERRQVQLHARYMLATALLLVGPVMVRITDRYVPGLIIHGPQDFGLFATNLRVASVFVMGVAAWLYAANPRFGRPWMIAGGVGVAQAVIFDSLSMTGVWRGMFAAIAGVPTALLLITGIAAGVAITWAGWQAGMVAKRRAVAA